MIPFRKAVPCQLEALLYRLSQGWTQPLNEQPNHHPDAQLPPTGMGALHPYMSWGGGLCPSEAYHLVWLLPNLFLSRLKVAKESETSSGMRHSAPIDHDKVRERTLSTKISVHLISIL